MMQIKETQGYRGLFNMQVRAGGEVVRNYAGHNHIVNGAKGVMARLVGGYLDGNSVSKIACGTGDAEVDDDDTAITEPFIKDVDGISLPEADQVQFDWHLDNGEYNGKSIKEFGLLTGDDTLFARIVLDAPIVKTAQFSVDVQWVVVFDNEDEEEDADGESD
jgi:hypothetical protein